MAREYKQIFKQVNQVKLFLFCTRLPLIPIPDKNQPMNTIRSSATIINVVIRFCLTQIIQITCRCHGHTNQRKVLFTLQTRDKNIISKRKMLTIVDIYPRRSFSHSKLFIKGRKKEEV